MKLDRTTAALLATLAFLAAPATAQTSAQHRATVEQQSKQVMPFDMNRTMHVFDPKVDGGLQTVIVQDGGAKQITLVRAHLRKEAAAFGRGDFADPALVHGAAMPGLAELRAGARQMRVTYAPVHDGATILFRSPDPKLVAALHQWFAAQVDEHGTHAAMGHLSNSSAIPSKTGAVQWAGKLQDVMMGKDLGTHLDLKELAGTPHLWNEVPIPATVADQAALERFIAEAAKINGVDVSQPFAFRIVGTPEVVRFHVLNRLGNGPVASADHDRNQVGFTLQNTPVEIVGFYSDHSQGVFTQMGTNVHMHVKTSDGTQAGHVDIIRLGTATRLSIPSSR